MKKNTTTIIHLGIDVAKDFLQIDTAIIPRLPQVPNTQAGFKTLLKALHKLPHPVHVVFEATGGDERPLLDALHQAAIPLSLLHPARVRDFAKACGLRAKTDALDAAALTRFASQMQPAPTPQPTQNQRDLQELTQRRTQLLKLLVMEKNRLPTYRLPALQQRAQRLSQIQGVGTTTALAVLAALPELGALNRRQAAALAGLAPCNRDSGRRQGLRSIGGGRAQARRALYRAAVSAARCNPVLRPFYQQLIAKGKLF